MPLFRWWRSRVSSPSPATDNTSVESPLMRIYTSDSESLSTSENHRQPVLPDSDQPKTGQVPKDPAPSSSSQEPSFLWQDIDPPTDLLGSLPQTPSSLPSRSSSDRSKDKGMMDPTTPTKGGSSRNSSLPGYNDVSGAVVVDWNGLPHFLSPQEEVERKSRLECAVRERMLGLSRRTDFSWESPCHGTTLPQYSPTKGKRPQRPSNKK